MTPIRTIARLTVQAAALLLFLAGIVSFVVLLSSVTAG